MKFTVDIKEFSATLKLLQSILSSGGTSLSTTLVVAKDILWVYGNNETITARCMAKGVTAIEGKGIAGVDITRLDLLLKGRASASFENMGTVFKFKAGKTAYGGDLAIIPVTKETIEGFDETLSKNKKAKRSSVDPEVFNALRNALALTSISVIHASDVLDTYVMLNDGNLEVVSSDNFHLAYCKIPVKTESNFQLSPTKTIFDVLGKLSDFYGGETAIEFSKEAIKAFNKGYSISTPTLQSSDTAFLRTKEYLGALPKPLCSFTLKVGATSAALDNILAIYEDGSLITAELKTKKGTDVLEFSMKSTMGVISDHIEVTNLKGKPFKTTFDPRMFKDSLLISKCPEATFSYIDGKSIILKCAKEEVKTTYINSVLMLAPGS